MRSAAPARGRPLTVLASAPGKINLSLQVGEVNERGYHELATVFQAVDLREYVTATLRENDGDLVLSLDSHVGGNVPLDESNLVIRAARLLRDTYGIGVGADLHIEKHVPVAGGMGGGSADAAAALVALNTLWGIGASHRELAALGARLGADVPFALHGGTALGTGIGTDLESLADLGRARSGRWHWVLASPGGELSTPAVFRRRDDAGYGGAGTPDAHNGEHKVTPSVPASLCRALGEGDLEVLATSMSNDLQGPATDLHPTLGPALVAAQSAGGLGALVSGSGPTVMMLASSAEHAAALAHKLAAHPLFSWALATTGPQPGARLENVPTALPRG